MAMMDEQLALLGGAEEPPKGDDAVKEVWDYYAHLLGTRRRLNQTRRRVIEGALRTADVETIRQAIVGLRVSPFHNGDNPQRKSYLDIRYALKGNHNRGEADEDRIAWMAQLGRDWIAAHGNREPEPAGAEAPPTDDDLPPIPADLPPVLAGALRGHYDGLLAAWRDPESKMKAEAARDSETWLGARGFTVKRASDGRPIIVRA